MTLSPTSFARGGWARNGFQCRTVGEAIDIKSLSMLKTRGASRASAAATTAASAKSIGVSRYFTINQFPHSGLLRMAGCMENQKTACHQFPKFLLRDSPTRTIQQVHRLRKARPGRLQREREEGELRLTSGVVIIPHIHKRNQRAGVGQRHFFPLPYKCPCRRFSSRYSPKLSSSSDRRDDLPPFCLRLSVRPVRAARKLARASPQAV